MKLKLIMKLSKEHNLTPYHISTSKINIQRFYLQTYYYRMTSYRFPSDIWSSDWRFIWRDQIQTHNFSQTSPFLCFFMISLDKNDKYITNPQNQLFTMSFIGNPLSSDSSFLFMMMGTSLPTDCYCDYC